MPLSQAYRPDPAILALDGKFYDPVAPADFPKQIELFWNASWAGRIGLGTLDPAERIAHFARFEPLHDNLPQPLALRYHGHQFDVYNRALGDGRGFLFAQLHDAAIDAGIATQFSPTEATVGLKELAQAGFNAQESMKLLIPVLDLAGGSLCAVMGYSGDINIARARSLEANPKQPAAIEALVPSGGATLFFDTMAIPTDAPHPGNALKWINYIARPEVAAGLTNKVFYANPNKESRKFVKPEIANNRTVFVTDADMKNMANPDALTNDIRRTMTRLYTSFKTGL